MTAPFAPKFLDRATRRAFAGLLALPTSARRKLAGTSPQVDGHPLNDDIALGLRALSALGTKELNNQTVADARHSLLAESWTFAGPRTDVGSVERITIPTSDGNEISARLYRPHPCPITGGEASDRPVALVMYFHGGGWVLGSSETHDPVARIICDRGEVAVLSVDFRLAPEHIFPAAINDSLDAYRWVRDHASELGVDPNRIAVAGDSAGGNIAAVISQKLARAGEATPAMQALLVPVTDMSLPRSRSYELFESGYFLTRANMEWYEALYLGGSTTPPANIDELRANPDVSPLLATDLKELADAGLPPAYVAVAGFDPLRDEGIAYANALRDAGVPTTLRVHTDCVHPFVNSPVTPVTQRCLNELVGALRMGLQV